LPLYSREPPEEDVIKGIGIDSIELERVARVYSAYGRRFLEKVYTQRERDYFARWDDPVPRIAGRFAVKEACMKALGTGWSGGVRWRDIEVVRHPSGRPVLELHGRAAEVCEALGARETHCTITHSRDHALAVVILEG
jgi:holo-[acyl-carrier protein] synthase